MSKKEIMKYDDLIMLSAFRYALGRQTYIVKHTVDYMLEHSDRFSLAQRSIIIKEIEIAIEKQGAGALCDVSEWTQLKDRLIRINKGELEPFKKKKEKKPKPLASKESVEE